MENPTQITEANLKLLATVVSEAHEWLTHNRQRLHHPVCTFHKPDPLCSCGLHKAMSGLSMVSYDLGVLAKEAKADKDAVAEHKKDIASVLMGIVKQWRAKAKIQEAEQPDFAFGVVCAADELESRVERF